ncbi:MAG TPA: rod shape-determining protein MreC [Gallionella sp.]|nr:rod shape-determining protein MreC [Gallionella sp.]
MHSGQSIQFFNRGPRPVTRLLFFALLSMLLLFVDARYRYLESTRSALSVVIFPLQRLATIPGVVMQRAGTFFATQRSLLEENKTLRQQHQMDAARAVQLQAVQQENQQLRSLLGLTQRGDFNLVSTEIVYAERDMFKRRVLVNKGADANVQAGQVVMDETGIIGQVTRIYPWLAEVTLITEKDHAVPVQVLRNGLRTVVFGTGDTSHLSLRYAPVSSDIQNGDVLVTSGIDGVYPQGIPVAKVERVERDAAYPFARVTCLPVAGVDQHRQLLILSGMAKLPERPAEEPAPADTGKASKARRKNQEVR